MIDLDNQTEYALDLQQLYNIQKFITTNDIELLVVYSDFIQDINKQTRGFDKPTDVLSFPLLDVPNSTSLGSIIVNIDYVKQKAKELKHSNQDEFNLLFIHGLLHLKGFDHENDNGEMREEEERAIKYFNLPDSLIIRS